MFTTEIIKSFNELEMIVYNYVMKHRSEVVYMTVRELAQEAHVSSSTVVRFCKKCGYDGYAEFKVKLKIYLQDRDKEEIRDSRAEIYHFFKSVDTQENEVKLQAAMKIIKSAKQVIFVGIGTSGILGSYGARMFANVNKFSLSLSDPFYPITDGMSEDTAVMALSVSGETINTITTVNQFREKKCKIISITNDNMSTIAKLSDVNLNYFVTEKRIERSVNLTTQVPVVYLLDEMTRRLTL
ncbi:MAG: MurR/RpiR family transcriptional regulator [Hespellia sp.]|nr:MurR/RpiR family transcriptional regulator [Hespellia sp.]